MTTRTVVPVGLWALRLAGVVFPVAVLAQAAFAGLFVTGSTGFLDMHSFNANVVVFSATLWVVAALVLRAPRRMLVPGVIAVALAVAQVAIGYARTIPLHIPVGVALFALGIRLAQLAFSYRGERK